MSIEVNRVRKYLKEQEFGKLFIEELGWDRHNSKNVELDFDGIAFTATPIAEKRGMVVFNCSSSDGQLPEYSVRRRIEKELAKRVHEHIVIFSNSARSIQTWQWTKREPGKPVAYREHTVFEGHTGEALVQKLEPLNFEIEEEEGLTIGLVTTRARQAFDVDRVTKRFYDRFREEHSSFLKFIQGVQGHGDREWYASLMLNRLMFVYFIQKKGFLDGDSNYLRNRMETLQKSKGKDKFLSFYRHFLLRLFHEGLGQQADARGSELDDLLGEVPYLNGGLFDVHELERTHSDIQISDEAFQRLFDFFDSYHWHLDDRPLRSDKEINPDVLGYIFEKYVNQKQMGAYYTKEDITEYIATNTIIPYLFRFIDATEGDTKSLLFDLLNQDPDRYTPPSILHGVDLELPAEIAMGLSQVESRNDWNALAPSEFAIPGETWREVVSRREHLEVLRKSMQLSTFSLDDCIANNLNLRQLAQDFVESTNSPEVISSLYSTLLSITILDPTCGSGAFLFAALNVLEPLYDACLARMQTFIQDNHPSKDLIKSFVSISEEVAEHPNERFFILKSIILRNLFGVDIMEEATEICKLRLFLKLMAQVHDFRNLEPLPDTDFNIRAGNTLVGFSTMAEVERAIAGGMPGQQRLDLNNTASEISAAAVRADKAFRRFHELQERLSVPTDIRSSKVALKTELTQLKDQLDANLANAYDVSRDDKRRFEQWREKYKPFHWCTEFYKIMQSGGFDVIVGNPPYLELRQVEYQPKDFLSLDSKAIHAMCIERSCQILKPTGSVSMIVPLALVSTQRMTVVQGLIEKNRSVHYANFSWRPGKLFDTVNRALTIFVANCSASKRTFSTNYQKWNSDTRAFLMPLIRFVEVPRSRSSFWVPKLGHEVEKSILNKVLSIPTTVSDFVDSGSEHRVFYRTTGGLYWKVFTNFAPAFFANGVRGHSTRETSFGARDSDSVFSLIAILSSDLFWWWYTITSNLRDLNPSDIQYFPVPENAVADSHVRALGGEYLADIDENSVMAVRQQKQTGRTETQSFRVSKSKPIIDRIDDVLAAHYGLSREELDFIKSYDIRFRIGVENSDD